MQNAIVDSKAKILFENYYDSEFVNTTQREIEDIRSRATQNRSCRMRRFVLTYHNKNLSEELNKNSQRYVHHNLPASSSCRRGS